MIIAGEALSLEESGALDRLIDYTFHRGAWPKNDVRPIRHWLGVSPQKFRSVRDGLVMKGLLVVCDGNLKIPLIERGFEEFLENEQNYHERASFGGITSGLNRKKLNENNENWSTEGEGEGEQESELESTLSDSEIFQQKLLRHLDAKPKSSGKELSEWVWADGVQIVMVTEGLNYKNAKSKIGSLLNAQNENAVDVAQILNQAVQKFFENPNQTIDAKTGGVLASPSCAEVPAGWALIASSDAGKRYAQNYRQEHGQSPEEVDGSYRVDRKTFSKVSDLAQ